MTKLFTAKPFIIAEIGSNWTSFTEAKDSISFAKACGADAVKFQLFRWNDLYAVGTDHGYEANRWNLDIDWLPKLKEKADACGIEFMCSAFSPELYDVIDPYVKVHKIASSECTFPHLLERVKSKGKPILLSTGASSKGDLAQAMQVLQGGPQVVMLYCSSAYPSAYYNLFQMQDLKKTFGVPVGFSDHSLDVVYPALSALVHFDAVVIEKHVNFAGHKTPDSGHSLSHEQFAFMCEILHGKRPYTEFNPQPEERDMFLRHNRRLIAIRDIHKGDAFRYGENFGAYRSLTDDSKGLIPFAWEEVVKSSGAKRDIRAGEGIAVSDFK